MSIHTVKFSDSVTFTDHTGVSFTKNPTAASEKNVELSVDPTFALGIQADPADGWFAQQSLCTISAGILTVPNSANAQTEIPTDVELVVGKSYQIVVDILTLTDASGIDLYIGGILMTTYTTTGFHNDTFKLATVNNQLLALVTLGAPTGGTVNIVSIKLVADESAIPELSAPLFLTDEVSPNNTLTYNNIGWLAAITGGDVVVFNYDDATGNYTDPDVVALTSQSLTLINCKDGSLGDLREHIDNNILALIDGKTASTVTQDYFLSNNGWNVVPVTELNPDAFTASFDFSHTSAMRETQTEESHPVHLLSPNYAICASHTGATIGEKLTFRRSDGTYQTVTTSAVSPLIGDDIKLLLLSDAVTGITPPKVLPRGWLEKYAPDVQGSTGDPVIHFINKNTQDMCINQIKSAPELLDSNVLYSPAGNASFVDWTAVVNNSSSGAHFIINGELILICAYWRNTDSDSIANHLDDIQSAMDSLGSSGDTLDVISLDGLFNDYT